MFLTALRNTYPWQLRYHNSHESQKIDDEICQVVMRIMSTEKKKHDRYAQKELFSRRVLIAIVDLFPHVQVVICASVEFKRYASDPVEHQIGPEHVDDVCECPRHLLRHTRDYVEQDLEPKDEDEVDRPGT